MEPGSSGNHAQPVEFRSGASRTESLRPVALPTGCDSRIDSQVFAAPPPVARSSSAAELERPPTCSNDIVIVATDTRARSRRDSTSWIGSFLAHALLLLLVGLLMAPVDLGSGGDVVLRLEPIQELQELETIRSLTLEEPAGSVAPISDTIDPLSIAPDEVVEISVSPDVGGATEFQRAPQGENGDRAGPSGSFFGIEAHGHEFVYIIDRSGSMAGPRFLRAAGELSRSIAGLRPSQKFYVLMFSSSHVQMFGSRSLRPQAIAATEENKEKLAKWLMQVAPSGSTKPRSALQIALQMDPSAVFMLSDGEFQDLKPGGVTEWSVMDASADSLEVVEKMDEPTPIHAIAFEDRASCDNMKQLAEMTGGKYRFEARGENTSAQPSIALARSAMRRGSFALAEVLLRGVMASGSPSVRARSMIVEFAVLRSKRALAAQRAGRMFELQDNLEALVRLDPAAEFTSDIQYELVDNLMASAAADPQKASGLLRELSRIDRKSKLIERYAEQATKSSFAEVDKLIAEDELAKALEKLHALKRQYSVSSVIDRCNAKSDTIAAQVSQKAMDLRDRGKIADYAEKLNLLISLMPKSKVSQQARQSMIETARSMLVEARDTKRDDRTRHQEIIDQLNACFGDSSILNSARRQLRHQERSARAILVSARNREARGETIAAYEAYQSVLESYPDSLAAGTARQWLSAHPSPAEAPDLTVTERIEWPSSNATPTLVPARNGQ